MAEFVEVKCSDCQNTQVCFSNPASVISCQVYGATLARPTGGRGEFQGEILEPSQ